MYFGVSCLATVCLFSSLYAASKAKQGPAKQAVTCNYTLLCTIQQQAKLLLSNQALLGNHFLVLRLTELPRASFYEENICIKEEIFLFPPGVVRGEGKG